MVNSAPDPRHTVAWQALRKQVVAGARRDQLPCPLCGQPIDYTASGRTPRGPSVDHIHPIALGGAALPHPSELRVTHNACNSGRGNRLRPRRPPRVNYSNPRI